MSTDEPIVFTSRHAEATEAVRAWVGDDDRRVLAVSDAISRHHRTDWGVVDLDQAQQADRALDIGLDVLSVHSVGTDDDDSRLLYVETPRFGETWDRRMYTRVSFSEPS